MTTPAPMKIVSLEAENLKRLKAVYIEPDGNLQVIAGRNAQGKSSVLDAIWLVLGGGAAARETARPIRDGEDAAFATLDLGDIVVTRKWSGTKTTLEVKGADGRKYSSPQTLLDALVGRLSFDPLAFTRMGAREQVAALLDLVDLDIDLDELAAQRAALYEERTDIGRRIKAIGDVPKVDRKLPTEEQSATDLLAKIREVEVMRAERTATEGRVNNAARQVTALKEQLAQWEADFARESEALAALPQTPDTAELETSLASLEETNAAIRANNAARTSAEALKAAEASYTAHTKEIDALDEQKAAALAGAAFPIDGLGFDEDGVTYNGVPFSQASSAEQIRVSLAMAMALNPRLHVIRINDGSLLDDDSMQIVAQMAAEKNYQVWLEKVGDGGPAAVVIEDGEVSA